MRSELALASQFNRLWTQIRGRLTRLPIVTLLLVFINVLVYCLVTTNSTWTPGLSFSLVLEMRESAAIQGQWWRLLTSAFLHLTFVHLISNLVFLFFLGWIAESLFGHLRLLLLWMACSIAGAIAELVFLKPGSVALGASGVVYGLMGTLLGIYGFRANTLSTRVRFLGIVLLVLIVGIGLGGDWHVRGRLVPAHAGGLLAGFLLAFAIPLSSKRTDGQEGPLASTPD